MFSTSRAGASAELRTLELSLDSTVPPRTALKAGFELVVVESIRPVKSIVAPVLVERSTPSAASVIDPFSVSVPPPRSSTKTECACELVMLAPTEASLLPPSTSRPSPPASEIATFEPIVKLFAPLTLMPAPEVFCTFTPSTVSASVIVMPVTALLITGFEPEPASTSRPPTSRPAGWPNSASPAASVTPPS